MSFEKRYDSVSDLVHEISEDAAFADNLDRQIEEQRMATTLFLMRNREGLTQAQLAERMGCTQSRVSKLEHASLSSISVQDLIDYSTALGAELNIVFQKMDASSEQEGHPRFSITGETDVDEELERDLERAL